MFNWVGYLFPAPLSTRGKKVVAEITLPKALMEDVLHFSAKNMYYLRRLSGVGSVLSGSINNGAHSPNGITAMFIATGQDVANVVAAAVNVEKGIGIPFFLKLFGDLKAAAKVGGDYKREITKKIEPKLTELIDNFNLLITEVNLQLHRIDKKGLLIIVEDLDKLDLPKAEDLFYNYSSQLTQIKANVIFTFPISLMYHYRFTSIRNYYDNNFELPMIKVINKDGTPNKEGRAILTSILKERMKLNLIAENGLESFLVKSGGCIRDLFRMIQTAALKALDFDRTIITRKDYCKAYWRLRNDYENSIAEKREDNYSRSL